MMVDRLTASTIDGAGHTATDPTPSTSRGSPHTMPAPMRICDIAQFYSPLGGGVKR